MIKIVTLLTKFIVFAIIAFALNSCRYAVNFDDNVKGNGTITTEQKTISEPFEGVSACAGILVEIEQSNAQFVSVETDSNIQKLVSTKVEKGVLVIAPIESIDPSKTIKVLVKMPKLSSVDASSSAEIKSIGTIKGSDISIDASSGAETNFNLQYDSISLDASSGSTITTKGIGLNLRTNASSGAKINAFDLLTNDISADVSSGANTNIHPIVKLKASASSGANIRYNNQPKSISIDESSGGSIEKE